MTGKAWETTSSHQPNLLSIVRRSSTLVMLLLIQPSPSSQRSALLASSFARSCVWLTSHEMRRRLPLKPSSACLQRFLRTNIPPLPKVGSCELVFRSPPSSDNPQCTSPAIKPATAVSTVLILKIRSPCRYFITPYTSKIPEPPIPLHSTDLHRLTRPIKLLSPAPTSQSLSTKKF